LNHYAGWTDFIAVSPIIPLFWLPAGRCNLRRYCNRLLEKDQMFSRRQFAYLASVLSALCFCDIVAEQPASAQTGVPKIVVTFPPGTGADILTHAIAEHIGKAHGTIMAIENTTPDAGTAAVARAAPDGATLLITNNNFVVDSHFRKLAHDLLTDFEPVCKLAIAQALIVVSTSSPYTSLQELIRGTQNHPGEVTITAAPGSMTHIGLEMLKRAASANITFVPISGFVTAVGAPPQLQAVFNGQAIGSIQTYQNSLPHLRAGTLRALAVTTRKRLDMLPEVPTVAEGGYAYNLDFWDGAFAPAGTPKEKLAQLAGWFSEALHDPGVRSKIGAAAFVPDAICGEDFVASIRKQQDEYGVLIREANIRPQ
jgi:tripartite-type tricarboxylate transporter receptor subunit TctC